MSCKRSFRFVKLPTTITWKWFVFFISIQTLKPICSILKCFLALTIQGMSTQLSSNQMILIVLKNVLCSECHYSSLKDPDLTQFRILFPCNLVFNRLHKILLSCHRHIELRLRLKLRLICGWGWRSNGIYSGRIRPEHATVWPLVGAHCKPTGREPISLCIINLVF